jgi:hypothetical protein
MGASIFHLALSLRLKLIEFRLHTANCCMRYVLDHNARTPRNDVDSFRLCPSG